MARNRKLDRAGLAMGEGQVDAGSLGEGDRDRRGVVVVVVVEGDQEEDPCHA